MPRPAPGPWSARASTSTSVTGGQLFDQRCQGLRHLPLEDGASEARARGPGALTQLLPARLVIGQQPGQVHELLEAFPVHPVGAVVDDLPHPARRIDDRHRSVPHRLGHRHPEVLALLGIILRAAQARRVPVDGGPAVELEQLLERGVGVEVDRVPLCQGPDPLEVAPVRALAVDAAREVQAPTLEATVAQALERLHQNVVALGVAAGEETPDREDATLLERPLRLLVRPVDGRVYDQRVDLPVQARPLPDVLRLADHALELADAFPRAVGELAEDDAPPGP